MSTIHNPINFKLEDYEIIDYLDNRRPEYYFGMTIEFWKETIEMWEGDMKRIFGKNWIRKIHQCIHCGQRNVRYIVACLHIPTNETVVFGNDCVEKLGFTNHDEFKIAQIRAKAELNHKRIKIYKMYLAYTEANPEILEAINCFENEKHKEIHERNSFASDVLHKLKQYGNLSERQLETIVASIKKDHERAKKMANEEKEIKGPAPDGRIEIEGEILGIKERESDFGIVLKMLVKLDNNSKVWCSLPSASAADKGDRIHFRATFTISNDDPHFAFGNRPHLIKDIIKGTS